MKMDNPWTVMLIMKKPMAAMLLLMLKMAALICFHVTISCGSCIWSVREFFCQMASATYGSVFADQSLIGDESLFLGQKIACLRIRRHEKWCESSEDTGKLASSQYQSIGGRSLS